MKTVAVYMMFGAGQILVGLLMGLAYLFKGLSLFLEGAWIILRWAGRRARALLLRAGRRARAFLLRAGRKVQALLIRAGRRIYGAAKKAVCWGWMSFRGLERKINGWVVERTGTKNWYKEAIGQAWAFRRELYLEQRFDSIEEAMVE